MCAPVIQSLHEWENGGFFSEGDEHPSSVSPDRVVRLRSFAAAREQTIRMAV